MMSSVISRPPCFSPVARDRRLQIRFTTYRSAFRLRPRKVFRVLSSDGNGAQVSNSNNETLTTYTEEALSSQAVSSLTEDSAIKVTHYDGQGPVSSQTAKTAKIHDFCLGIPFGGVVLGGGIVSLILTKNPSASLPSVLIGGALLLLSTLSMKVWRQGKSSLLFILGQAALVVAFLWKNFKSYSLTPNLFPTGLNAALSAAMLCFYTYVMVSGGNPPPKKLKLST